MTRSSTLIRALSHTVTEWAPSSARKALTSVGKRVRSTVYGARIELQPPPGRAILRAGLRLWEGKRAAVLLTHDLDTKRCLTELDQVLAAEEREGFRSVVLVLTGGGYQVDGDWARDLTRRGHEVGLQ